MEFNLTTIYDLINFPKAQEPPPTYVKVLKRFYEQDYTQAIKELGSLRIEPETEKVLRQLFFYQERGLNCLVLGEISKKQPGL